MAYKEITLTGDMTTPAAAGDLNVLFVRVDPSVTVRPALTIGGGKNGQVVVVMIAEDAALGVNVNAVNGGGFASGSVVILAHGADGWAANQ